MKHFRHTADDDEPLTIWLKISAFATFTQRTCIVLAQGTGLNYSDDVHGAGEQVW